MGGVSLEEAREGTDLSVTVTESLKGIKQLSISAATAKKILGINNKTFMTGESRYDYTVITIVSKTSPWIHSTDIETKCQAGTLKPKKRYNLELLI